MSNRLIVGLLCFYILEESPIRTEQILSHKHHPRIARNSDKNHVWVLDGCEMIGRAARGPSTLFRCALHPKKGADAK